MTGPNHTEYEKDNIEGTPIMDAIQKAMSHWEHIAPVLTPPETEEAYNQMVSDLDAVLDAGGANEEHTLAGFAERIGDLIAAYEDQHHPI